MIITNDLVYAVSVSGVSFVCNHKYAFATSFFSLGYALYMVFTLRKEIGYGLNVISIGFEIEDKSFFLVEVVTSGSEALAGIFSG